MSRKHTEWVIASIVGGAMWAFGVVVGVTIGVALTLYWWKDLYERP